MSSLSSHRAPESEDTMANFRLSGFETYGIIFYTIFFICLPYSEFLVLANGPITGTGRAYQKMCEGTFPVEFITSSTVAGRSKLDCVIKCSRDLCCNTFTFEKSTGTCHFSHQTERQCTVVPAPHDMSFYRVRL